MCKKLMFLISLVLLIGWGAVASAANLNVSSGTTYTVSGTEDYDAWNIQGTCIVPAGATLTATGRSEVDGEFPDGTLIIDGGTASVSYRLDLGKGDGSTLIIQNGGEFTQSSYSGGIKVPDDGGGAIRVRVREGTLTAEAMEVIGIGSYLDGDSDRNARIEIGAGAVLNVGNTDESPPNRYDPDRWLLNGDMYGIEGVTNDQITITDMGGDWDKVEGPPACGDKAMNPSPADGEKGVASVVSDVEICWSPACGIGDLGRHYVFFSTDKDCVDNAPTYTMGWDPPDCYVHPPLWANVTCKNMGNRPIWTKYYWRIDSKLEAGDMIKGDTWSFTTGCDPVPPGDANLDCLVNLDDWALMLTTWGEEQFFPWD